VTEGTPGPPVIPCTPSPTILNARVKFEALVSEPCLQACAVSMKFREEHGRVPVGIRWVVVPKLMFLAHSLIHLPLIPEPLGQGFSNAHMRAAAFKVFLKGSRASLRPFKAIPARIPLISASTGPL
jgi:hypothetical protein